LIKLVTILLGLAVVLCVSPSVAADDDGAKPEATKAPAAEKNDGKKAAAAPVVCVAREVIRSVSYRPTLKDKWRALKAGQGLALGSDICTGLRATCRLEFNDRSSVAVVQPMTTMRIGEFEKTARKVRTRLFLKQGTVRADVERVRFQSDFAVVSTEATLAVLGTDGIELRQYQDTGSQARLLKSGLLRASNNKTGRGQNVRPGDKVTGNMDPAIQNTHGDKVVAVYDTHGGNTEGEVKSIKGRSQTFTGTGNQAGPGGKNWIGGFASGFSRGKSGLGSFFKNNPSRLPNYVPPPVVTPKQPSSSSNNGHEH